MSNSMNIKGTIHTIFETKQVSEKFSKREFVVTVEDGKYSQTVIFQTTGKNIGELDGYSVGDEVSVEFNVRGREWRNPAGETRFFNSLEAWRIQRAGAAKPAVKPTAQGYGAGGDDSDVPF